MPEFPYEFRFKSPVRLTHSIISKRWFLDGQFVVIEEGAGHYTIQCESENDMLRLNALAAFGMLREKE